MDEDERAELDGNPRATDRMERRLDVEVEEEMGRGGVSLFRQLPLPCVETTLRGTTQRANAAAAHFFNVQESFLIARPLLHFVARGDCDAFRAAVECVASGKSVDRIALRFRPRGHRPVLRVQLSARQLRGLSRPAAIFWVIERDR
jgi:hypothetical protein